MFSRDYLALRLVRLKTRENWVVSGEGFSFIFWTSGQGKYQARTHAQKLEPGDVAIAGANSGHFCAANGGEVVFWCFSLCVEHLFPLFSGDELSLLSGLKEILGNFKLYPLAHPLAKECHRLVSGAPPQFDLGHRSYLLQVASVILSEEFKAARTQRSGFVRVDEHMTRVFENLMTEELLTASVGELAAKFGCSRRHLNRLFNQYFGVSVGALRMEMRLLKAVSLLRDPTAKVINVAEACGFNHLGLFNTCFKKRFGCTPGQWRAKCKKDVKAPQPQAAGSGCPLKLNGLCPWTGEDGCETPGKELEVDEAKQARTKVRPAINSMSRDLLGSSETLSAVIPPEQSLLNVAHPAS